LVSIGRPVDKIRLTMCFGLLVLSNAGSYRRLYRLPPTPWKLSSLTD